MRKLGLSVLYLAALTAPLGAANTSDKTHPVSSSATAVVASTSTTPVPQRHFQWLRNFFSRTQTSIQWSSSNVDVKSPPDSNSP